MKRPSYCGCVITLGNEVEVLNSLHARVVVWLLLYIQLLQNCLGVRQMYE